MKYIAALILLVLAMACSAEPLHILVMVANNYGGNSMLNREYYERKGWEITLTGVTETVSPCSGDLPQLEMDILVDDIEDISPYDAIVIWPSRWWVNNPYGDLINSDAAISLLQAANSQGKIIWATCGGTLLLAAADIINGKRVQGQSGNNNAFVTIYTNAGATWVGQSLPPVIDENIITTTRGQFLWELNNEAILTTWLRNRNQTGRVK